MAKIKMSELMIPLSDEERKELEEAEKRLPYFDEDSPEMTAKQLQQFKRMYSEDRTKRTVSIRLSKNTYDKARTYGKGYTAFLSRLLDVAINDENLVRKCV
ncbi:MAG: hypothetical protein IKE24_05255 [Clostridia bacterium]|nr:hypothetical protein [Clostridia bacterium]